MADVTINAQAPQRLSWDVVVCFKGKSKPRNYTMTGVSQGSAMLRLVGLLMDANVPPVVSIGFTRKGGAA